MTFPFPPRRMRSAMAAYYMSVSESTFLARVRAGTYPPGIKDGGVTVWLRDDLDRVIDRQFQVKADVVSPVVARDPFMQRFGQAHS